MKKSLKKQAVFPVLMLLVVTALALIGSSFAWFSMANTASLTEVTGTTEKGSVGLMISKDASTFTSEVTLDSDAATFVNPAFFHQVSTIDAQTFYGATITQKNPNGTAAMIKTAADNSVAWGPQCYGKYKNSSSILTNMTVSGAQYVLASSGAASTQGTSGAVANEASYMVFDLFFSVDNAADLYLDNGTTFTAGTALNAMRVAFIDYSGSATDASGAIAISSVEDTLIWDPHGDASYFGIKGASGATAFAPYATHATYAESVDTYASTSLFVNGTSWTDESTFTGYYPIATLAAGVNKLRVVVWLEGNDPDCTATLAANKGISFAMNFFAKANS